MMTPQLYINYKLKSVAHMPWRVMIYKSLNTFIDDLFAFIIKMPLLHRLSCFRDDIIFFIFLYQRYIYDIDETRLNEFGVSKEMYAEAEGSGADADADADASASEPAALADVSREPTVAPSVRQRKAEPVPAAAPAAAEEWTKMGDDEDE
jgi:hypothetical protein